MLQLCRDAIWLTCPVPHLSSVFPPSSASGFFDATQFCQSQLLVVILLLLRQCCKGLFKKKIKNKKKVEKGKVVKKISVIQGSVYTGKSSGGRASLM